MLLASVIAVLAGCNPTPTGSGGGCTPAATRVCMSDNQFVPLNLTVARGTQVTWTNGDGFTHTVTNAEGSTEIFDQSVPGGGTFSKTFNILGAFRYFCKIHGIGGPAPSGMHGTITVK